MPPQIVENDVETPVRRFAHEVSGQLLIGLIEGNGGIRTLLR
jgi:hypothetical protein